MTTWRALKTSCARTRKCSRCFPNTTTDEDAAGINADQDEFVLSRVLEGDEEYADFEKSLLIFIQCLRKWKQTIREGQVADAVQAAPQGVFFA